MGKGQKRRRFSAEEKMALLRTHFLEKVTVLDLCEEAGIRPTLFFNWQRQFFESGTAAFERRSPAPSKEREAEEKIAALEEKLARKNEVVAELIKEHIALKKG